MSRQKDFDADVIIAGGGFSGLPLALALAGQNEAHGLSVIIADREPPEALEDAAFDGRAFALSAASVRLLGVLGIWETVAEHAQAMTGIHITDTPLDAPLRPVLLDLDNEATPGEPGAYILESHWLKRATHAAIANRPDIRIEAPDAVTGFEIDENGVTATLESGRTLRAPLLVAADGRRSLLRDLAGIGAVDWSSSQTGIVTTVAHERPHEGRAVQHFLPSGPFAILPLTGNRSSLVWTETGPMAQAVMALDETAFEAQIQRRFGWRLGRIKLAGPRNAFPLMMNAARDYVRPRFALCGDSAHGMHWIAGQGLNYGLRDVAALTQVLVEAQRLGRDIGSMAVLERYERWRRFDSIAFTAGMAALNALFSNNNALLRGFRDFGLSAINRLPLAKRLFVQEAAGLTGDVPRLLKGERV